MQTIEKTCLTCGCSFRAPFSEHRRGNGKYCSLTCSARRPIDRRPNRTCAWCGIPFRAVPSDRRRALAFCGKACATRHMWRNNPPKGNLGATIYRQLALDAHGLRCVRCGFAECAEILEAHHRDHDRSNNRAENLEVLCPTCHRLHHYRTHSGPWLTSPR